ncbi:MAG: amidohydrolase family protein [Planctomycetaceae bacterium]|nr:amidohydrolase family protein [Planctomycetaceae bacterium]
MIIDVNTHLGHYPFRPVRFTSAARMIEHMDAHGIDMAVVSSLHAVFYRDSHRGNEELFQDVRQFPDRLIPVATVNPKYVGWERDLEESVRRWNAKGVTLLPEHHGYSLTGELGRAALGRIVDYDLPVVLTQRLEDRRQRHHWDVAEDLTTAQLTEVAAAHPKLRCLLSNWIGLNGAQLIAAGLRGRCLIDFARLDVLLNKAIPKLVDELRVESIAFGSHLPFDYLGPSLVKLANIAALFPAEDYEKIAWKNAAAFFRLEIAEGRTGRRKGGP